VWPTVHQYHSHSHPWSEEANGRADCFDDSNGPDAHPAESLSVGDGGRPRFTGKQTINDLPRWWATANDTLIGRGGGMNILIGGFPAMTF